jgi:hypothetical protein
MTNTFKFELEEKSTSKIIEFFDQTKKILILTGDPRKYHYLSKNNEFSLEIPILIHDNAESIDAYLSNKNNLEIITKKQNYDIIVLDQILEFLSDPSMFLKNISGFLSSNGIIVGCINNFSNILNRIKFLDGELDKEKLSSTTIFSLEDILLSLSNSNLKMTKLDRIEKQISKSNQIELKNYVLPLELLNSINDDSESQTFFYVFTAILGATVNPQTRKLISDFSKNLVTEKLNDIFNQMRFEHEKQIIYLKQSNQEQYDLIKHLKQGLSDKDAYAEQVIKDKDAYAEQVIKDKDEEIKSVVQDKDAYAEQVIKDKDAYAEQVIKDKDEIINSLQQSSAFKLLRTLDKLTGKTRK